jgi:hypothetical protein
VQFLNQLVTGAGAQQALDANGQSSF